MKQCVTRTYPYTHNSSKMAEVVVAPGPVSMEDRTISWKKIGTIAACGTALFADGYVNNSIGPVNTILKKLYPKIYPHKQPIVTAIAFVGTVVGMVVFGYYSDAIGRKSGMIVACLIIIVFSALSSGSYFNGETGPMIDMLTAWRFFTGIGVGAEYPTGSVAAAEQSEELPKSFQHAPFILATNLALVMGSVCANMVPFILTLICTENHLRLVWRLSIGLVIVPCLFVLPFRMVVKQPKLYVNGAMKPKKTPYWLVIKFYWFRLTSISVLWFIYDFIVFPIGIFSSLIINTIIGQKAPLWKSFAWSALIVVFGIPGSVIGAFLADKIGPKRTFIVGITLQIITGFIMAGLFSRLHSCIPAFCVVYGLFQSFGQLGPGDNLGLLASKSCASGVKGQFYGIAAAIGKIGAFAGTYAFPVLQSHYAAPKNGVIIDQRYYTVPFYLFASLDIIVLLMLIFVIKERSADCQIKEEMEFKQYLLDNGVNLSSIGRTDTLASNETIVEDFVEKADPEMAAPPAQEFATQKNETVAPHPY